MDNNYLKQMELEGYDDLLPKRNKSGGISGETWAAIIGIGIFFLLVVGGLIVFLVIYFEKRKSDQYEKPEMILIKCDPPYPPTYSSDSKTLQNNIADLYTFYTEVYKAYGSEGCYIMDKKNGFTFPSGYTGSSGNSFYVFNTESYYTTSPINSIINWTNNKFSNTILDKLSDANDVNYNYLLFLWPNVDLLYSRSQCEPTPGSTGILFYSGVNFNNPNFKGTEGFYILGKKYKDKTRTKKTLKYKGNTYTLSMDFFNNYSDQWSFYDDK